MKIKLRKLLPIILSISILIVYLIGLIYAAVNNNGLIGGLFNIYNSIGWDYNSKIETTKGYRFDARNIYPTDFSSKELRTKGNVIGGTGIFLSDLSSNNGTFSGYVDANSLILTGKATSQTGTTNLDSSITLTTKGYVASEINKFSKTCPSGQFLISIGKNTSTCKSLTTNLSCPNGGYLQSIDLLTGNKTCSAGTY